MIGERLKKLREERGILQRQLAEMLKLTQQTISLYESNKREPDAETLSKIADFFGVTIDYLLGRTDNPNPTEDSTIDDEIMAIMRDLGPDITLQFKENYPNNKKPCQKRRRRRT